MRINAYLAKATGISRRAADVAVAAGRVTIDGRGARIGEAVATAARVALDGRPLSQPETLHYILLNKPAGYVCSRARQGTAPTIYELLPPSLQHLRLAGRLDTDSSGLVLLSDDGSFIHRYSHPSEGKTKIYQLTLAHDFTNDEALRLEAGIELKDGTSRVHVVHASGREITLSMAQGRNRQLRRTLGAIGHRILRLHRVQVGDYHAGDLKSGAWKHIEGPAK